MIIKYVLPLIALALLVFAVQQVVGTREPQQDVQPPIQPSRSPYENTVAGAGIVEAQTENIEVGATMPGLVVEVYVKVHDKVHAGAPLFKLDDRQLKADLEVRKAAVQAERAELMRLENQPRREQLPSLEAALREAEADMASADDELRRAQRLNARGPGVVTEQEIVSRRQAHNMAQARAAKAKADLELMRAGAWQYDKDVAAAAVKQAQAQVDSVAEEIKRTTITALVESEVLQVNVHPGEFVGTPHSEPLIVLGNVKQLHVRVDVDEHDIPRFVPGAPAQAVLKGDSSIKYPLRFVRVEPYVIPKRSLTGQNTERVDTRVLQAIYELEPTGQALYVGQQVEVYIDARKGRHGKNVE
ncbi:MAG: HlyD family efflux transporter periplasmic adaptor subunit [Pirellulales bacterium]